MCGFRQRPFSVEERRFSVSLFEKQRSVWERQWRDVLWGRVWKKLKIKWPVLSNNCPEERKPCSRLPRMCVCVCVCVCVFRASDFCPGVLYLNGNRCLLIKSLTWPHVGGMINCHLKCLCPCFSFRPTQGRWSELHIFLKYFVMKLYIVIGRFWGRQNGG